MAKNFEIIIPADMDMLMADGISRKRWTFEDIKNVCESHNCKWIISKHPSDKEADGKKDGDITAMYCKFEHWHCGIHTSSDNTYDTIAKWFGVAVHSVNKVRGKFDSTYALYLIHYNAFYEDGTPKPSIPQTDVVTNFGLDYTKLIGHVETSTAKDDILEQIAKGEIKRYQLHDKLTDAFLIRYDKQIKIALQIWNDRKMKGERGMAKNVIWIYGNAGVGKTEFAKYLAKTMFGEYDWFMSDSGNNPFDNYGDQPCIILDDVGTDNLNSKVVLKLFDPYNKCFTKARYYNRAIDADMMIVTSSISPEMFWTKCRDTYNVNGSWEQLLRRLTGGVYHFIDSENVECVMYDSKGENPVKAKIQVPDDVKNKTVTVSSEARLKNAMAKFNMSFTLSDDNKSVDMNGHFEQMELDDTPWAPRAADARDGAPSDAV